MARMVSEYLAVHPTASPEAALSDCLIGTQCPPCPDDHETLLKFHSMWQEILVDSQQELHALTQWDLEFARQAGTPSMVAARRAADHHRKWQLE